MDKFFGLRLQAKFHEDAKYFIYYSKMEFL